MKRSSCSTGNDALLIVVGEDISDFTVSACNLGGKQIEGVTCNYLRYETTLNGVIQELLQEWIDLSEQDKELLISFALELFMKYGPVSYTPVAYFDRLEHFIYEGESRRVTYVEFPLRIPAGESVSLKVV